MPPLTNKKPTSAYADRKELEKWICVICTCGMKKSENDTKTAAGEK